VFRLPLKYLKPGESQGFLSNGEKYGFLKFDKLPSWLQDDDMSFLPRELKKNNAKEFYIFGAFTENEDIPLEIPHDPLASRIAFPDDPEKLAKDYAKKAHWLEIVSCILFALGIGLNGLFIALIFYIIWM
jgi:hypothetical protein